MKIINAKIRKMKDEFSSQGIQKETEEIRETYDLNSFRSNITFLPRNETQPFHKHLLVIEAVHVLTGVVEVTHNGKCRSLNERQVAMFAPGEVHNILTRNPVKEITYPNATKNTAAVAIVYKWIPPVFKIYNDEIELVIQNDWFSDKFDLNNIDPRTSPVLKLEKPLQKKYWNIVKRNKLIKVNL